MTDLDQKNLKQSESGDVKRQVKFCPVCRGNRWFNGNVCESAAEHPGMAPQAVAKAAAAGAVQTTTKPPVKPLFKTAWEREDYERQQRGEAPLGPRAIVTGTEQSSYDRGFNAGVERVAAMLDARAPTELTIVVEHLAMLARKFKVG